MERENAYGEAIVIKFIPGIFGNQLFSLPETRKIKELLPVCSCGLKLAGEIGKSLAATFDKTLLVTPDKKPVDYIPLSSKEFMKSPADADQYRIKLVFE